MNSICAILAAVVWAWWWTGNAAAQDESDFEKWQQEEQAGFEEYLSKEDQEFLGFLKKEWKAAQLLQGITQDEVPKPVKIPVAVVPPQKSKAPAGGKVITSLPAVIAPPPPKPTPVQPPPPKPKPSEPPSPEGKKPPGSITVSFFSEPVTLSYDEKMRLSQSGGSTKEFIGTYWETLSRADYQECMAQIQEYKKRLNLNDWGYCQLLYEAGKSINKGDRNGGNLFAWFILSKSGYQVKVGYIGNRILLLITSDTPLYGVSFFTLAGAKYYALPFEDDKEAISSLSTYEGNYPGSERGVSFRISSPPTVEQVVMDRTYQFNYDGQDYQVPVKLSKGAIDFYRRYPQTSIQVYFAAAPSPETSKSLLEALRPMIVGKTEAEAVNILLRFVQTSLNYQIDEEQFGREKSLFPEETLFYPYSDCEDRAILFSYLVRNLLGLKVIGLDYPGHIATAVKFSSEVGEGDFVVYNQQQYAVCDPTFINANWGMAMPQLKDTSPKVISMPE